MLPLLSMHEDTTIGLVDEFYAKLVIISTFITSQKRHKSCVGKTQKIVYFTVIMHANSYNNDIMPKRRFCSHVL